MLYEPTNIVPSTLTNTGAIDVNDNIEISWQVNGNSALTGYRIDFYTNDTNSNFVSSYSENPIYLPFYGRDQLGNTQIFNPYIAGTWAGIFGLQNGNAYKFRITQYYDNGQVTQGSFSAVYAYQKPSITAIKIRNITTNNTLPQSLLMATAIVEAQDYNNIPSNAIQSVRWQLYNGATHIDDTKKIDTSELAYEYGGLQTGNSYTLICTITTEMGQIATNSIHFNVEYRPQAGYEPNFQAQCVCRDDSVLLNWQLSEETNKEIDGVATPPNGYKIYNANNQLLLNQGSKIRWDSVKTPNDETAQPMRFNAPWTAYWRGNLEKQQATLLSTITGVNGEDITSKVNCAAFSPDGNTLVLGGSFTGYALIYKIQNNQAVLVSKITQNGTALSGIVNCVEFSPDGNTLVLGGSFNGKASIYSISGQTLTYRSNITIGGSSILGTVYAIAFNPAGTIFVLGNGTMGYCATVYSVSGYTFTQQNQVSPNSSIGLTSPVSYSIAIGSVQNSCVIGYSGLNGSSRTVYYASAYTIDTSTYAFTLIKRGVAPNEDIVNDGSLNDIRASTLISDNVLNSYFLMGSRIVNIRQNYPVWQVNVIAVSILNNVSGVAYSRGDNSVVLSQESGNVLFAYYSNTVHKLQTIEGIDTISSAVAINNQTHYFVIGNSLGQIVVPNVDLLTLNDNGMVLSYVLPHITLSQNGTQLATLNAVNYTQAVISISPTQLGIYDYLTPPHIISGGLTADLSYIQPIITSIELQGKQVSDYVAIERGYSDTLYNAVKSKDFYPKWLDSDYSLYFNAEFIGGLSAGTASNNGFMIYRRGDELVRLPTNVDTIKDYGIASNSEYEYTFYAYNADKQFVGEKTQSIPARQFRAYSLLATQYSEIDGCYHVYKEFRFGANVQNMSVSNNANSSYVQNFTPYPTRQYSSANYKSGALQALIGFVDQEANRYFDDTKLMDELYALSTADFTLFLRDLKGNLYMIAPNGAITMTPNNKTAAQEVTISFPWVEIGDASQVSIIQLPTDAGWNNDAQLLDVKLGIDFATGELIVTYPYPYYGTKFNYTKQTGQLRTTTPADVTSRNVTLDTESSSATSGAVLADNNTNTGGGES